MCCVARPALVEFQDPTQMLSMGDFLNLSLTCREAYNYLAFSDFWLRCSLLFLFLRVVIVTLTTVV